MKIMIDIPGIEFDQDIADKFQDYFGRVLVDISDMKGACGNYEIETTDMFLAAFKRLKVLPKGHGRLIDADSIYQIVKPIVSSDTEWVMTAETAKRLIKDAFDKSPTIIEADKESEKE